MKTRIVSLSILVSTSLIGLLLFNNCTGGMRTMEQAELSSQSENKTSINESYESDSDLTVVGLVGDAAGSNASCAAEASALKVLVAASPSGPWVENGAACRGKVSYFKVTGLKGGEFVRGCTSPIASNDCLLLANHRDYLSSERVGADIVTSISAADSNNWPLGSYNFYVSISGDRNINIIKVGSAKLENCSGTSTPGSSSSPGSGTTFCNWEMTPAQFVIGGGTNVVTGTCSASTKGTIKPGYYDMGNGDPIYSDYICNCQ